MGRANGSALHPRPRQAAGRSALPAAVARGAEVAGRRVQALVGQRHHFGNNSAFLKYVMWFTIERMCSRSICSPRRVTVGALVRPTVHNSRGTFSDYFTRGV